MNHSQTNTDPEIDGHSVAATLLPRPGAFARAFFRCTLFASVPVLVAFVLSVVLDSQPLVGAATALAGLLTFPLFILSVAFFRSDRRLAFLGIFVLWLFLLVYCIAISVTSPPLGKSSSPGDPMFRQLRHRTLAVSWAPNYAF